MLSENIELEDNFLALFFNFEQVFPTLILFFLAAETFMNEQNAVFITLKIVALTLFYWLNIFLGWDPYN